MADSEIQTSEENTEDDVFNAESGIQRLELYQDTSEIPEWLQDVESPFNWLQVRFPDVPRKEVITKAMERTEMDEGLEDDFPFEKFVRLLTLVFEFTCQGNETDAWKNFMLDEELIEKEKDKDEKTYSKLSEALRHALMATRAHLLLRKGNDAEAKKVAADIQPVREMSVHGLAAVQGLRARFFHHYRGEGARLALQYARQALNLAPDLPLWQVLTAQSIRRLRKFQLGEEEVSAEEVELLERAVACKRNARHLVLLAQAYREWGDSRFKKYRNQPDFFQSHTFSEISNMQAKSFQLYKDALSLRPDSEIVNRLCGYGLLKLPAFKSDYRLAEHCLQRALEQYPNNPTTIHALGLYYYKGLMEYEKAALFCEKAGKLGNFPASLDMLRMKRLVYGSNYDPVFDFRKLLQQYGDNQTKTHEILCQMGSYYLFFERNLSKALKYFKTLIKEKADPSIMTSHKCTFLNMACKINLFQCIVNEGQQLLKENTELNLEREENGLKEVKTFLDELRETNTELFYVPINISLIDDLHKVSDDIKQTYVRKKERRDSCKERHRRSSITSRRCSLDDNVSKNLRRQSESSINFRRKSSGNVESFQNRSYKNPSNTNHKQTSLKTNDMERNLNCQKRHEFYKSNGYHLDSVNTNLRRKSSGAISDLAVARSPRTLNSPKQKQQFFDSSQISEIIKETSQETEKPSPRNKSGEFNRSNDSEKKSARKGNEKPLYKRYISWNGNSAHQEHTNWRIKDNKD